MLKLWREFREFRRAKAVAQVIAEDTAAQRAIQETTSSPGYSLIKAGLIQKMVQAITAGEDRLVPGMAYSLSVLTALEKAGRGKPERPMLEESTDSHIV